MHIKFYKQKEDANFVWYKFEVEVGTDEIYKDKKGIERCVYKLKSGLFKFNKMIRDSDVPINNILIIEKNETDPFFWDNVRFIIVCFRTMRQFKDFFPEKANWVSCEEL